MSDSLQNPEPRIALLAMTLLASQEVLLSITLVSLRHAVRPDVHSFTFIVSRSESQRQTLRYRTPVQSLSHSTSVITSFFIV